MVTITENSKLKSHKYSSMKKFITYYLVLGLISIASLASGQTIKTYISGAERGSVLLESSSGSLAVTIDVTGSATTDWVIINEFSPEGWGGTLEQSLGKTLSITYDANGTGNPRSVQYTIQNPFSGVIKYLTLLQNTNYPTITGLYSTPVGRLYGIGEVFDISVTLDQACAATTSMKMFMYFNNGGIATFNYMSGTQTAVFKYKVGNNFGETTVQPLEVTSLKYIPNASLTNQIKSIPGSLQLYEELPVGVILSGSNIGVDPRRPVVEIDPATYNGTSIFVYSNNTPNVLGLRSDEGSSTFYAVLSSLVSGIPSVATLDAIAATNSGEKFFSPTWPANVFSTSFPALSTTGLDYGIYTSFAVDNAGNVSTNNPTFLVYDGIPPTVTISALSPNYPTYYNYSNGTSTIPVTVTFSEPVSGFVVGDVSVNNATVADFASVNSSVYTFNILATPQLLSKVISVDIASSVASDVNFGLQNGNLASASHYINYDQVGPIPTITSIYSGVKTNVQNMQVVLNFGEPTSVAFAVGALTVYNGGTITTVGNLLNTVYTFNVTPASITQEGAPITVEVLSGSASDIALNPTTASSRLSIYYDGIGLKPVLTLHSLGNPTSADPLQIRVVFGEQVTAYPTSLVITSGGLSYTARTISFVNSVTTADYVVNIIGTNVIQGLIGIQMPAGQTFDLYGNASSASSILTVNYDKQGPSVTAVSFMPVVMTGGKTGTDNIPVNITFSEPISGLDATNVSVTYENASTLFPVSVVGFTSITNSIYSFSMVLGEVTGIVRVQVPAGVTFDLAQSVANSNLISSIYSFEYDGIRPIPTLTSAKYAGAVPVSSGTLINGTEGTYIVYVDFGKQMNVGGAGQFSLTDVSITANPTVPTLSGLANLGAGKYSFIVTPTSTISTISINIKSGSVTRITPYNTLCKTAASDFVLYYDAVYPLATISSPTTASGAKILASQSVFSFNVGFNEIMKDFDATKVLVSSQSGVSYTFSGTPTSINTNKNVVNFDITGISGQGWLYVDVAANAGSDLANNGSIIAARYSIEIDRIRPVPTISANVSLGQVVNSTVGPNVVNVKVNFGETVKNLSSTSITLTSNPALVVVSNLLINGSQFTEVGGGIYTFNMAINPNTEGTVFVTIANGAAMDLADNVSSVSLASLGDGNNYSFFSFTYDGIEPTGTIEPYDWTDFLNAKLTNHPNITMALRFSESVSVTAFPSYLYTIIQGVAAPTAGAGGAANKLSIVDKNNHTITLGTSPAPLGASDLYTFEISGLSLDRVRNYLSLQTSSVQDLAGNLLKINASSPAYYSFVFDDIAPTPTFWIAGVSYGSTIGNINSLLLSTNVVGYVNFGTQVDNATWRQGVGTDMYIADVVSNITYINAANGGILTAPPSILATSAPVAVGDPLNGLYSFNIRLDAFQQSYGMPSKAYYIHSTTGIVNGVNGVASSSPFQIQPTGVATLMYSFNLDVTRPQPQYSLMASPSNSVLVQNSVTNNNIFILTVNFGEAIDQSTLQVSDISVTFKEIYPTQTTSLITPTLLGGNTLSGVYTFQITLPASARGWVGIQMSGNYDKFNGGTDLTAIGSVNDTYGNPSFPTSVLSVYYDTYRPMVDLSVNQRNTFGSAIGATVNTGNVTIAGMKGAGTADDVNALLVTVRFEESLLPGSFIASEVSVSGSAGLTIANISGFAADATNSVYTFEIGPMVGKSGTILLDIASGVASSLAYNPNQPYSVTLPSAPFTVNYDGIAPTPTITLISGYDLMVNNRLFRSTQTSYALRVNFGETIDNTLLLGSVVASNCDIPTFPYIDGGNGIYTINLFVSSPTNFEKTIEIDVFGLPNQPLVTDIAGNYSSQVGDFYGVLGTVWHGISIEYDGLPPTAVITSSPVALDYPYTNLNPVTFSIEFSENVINLINSDILVNGLPFAGVLTPVTAKNYTFPVVPGALNQTLNISLPSGVCTDLFNSLNREASYSIIYDGQLPVPTVSSYVANNLYTNDANFPVYIGYGELIKSGQFVATDITVTNTISPLTSVFADDINGNYTFNAIFSSLTDGLVATIDVPQGIAMDRASNLNSRASQKFSITYDGTAPNMTIAGFDLALGMPTIKVKFSTTFAYAIQDNLSGIYSVNMTFKGAQGGFISPSPLTNIMAPFGSLSAVNFVDPAVTSVVIFTYNVYMEDQVGNSSNRIVLIEFDNSNPIPTISSLVNVNVNPKVSPTYLTTIPVIVNFKEQVVGFTTSDIVRSATVGSLNISDLGVTSPTTAGVYTFNLNLVGALSNSIITLDIAADISSDMAGNPNFAASRYTIQYDAIDPIPVISSTLVTPVYAFDIPVYINFGEAMRYGVPYVDPTEYFLMTDLIVTSNGTTITNPAFNFRDDLSGVYSFNVNIPDPNKQGILTINVPAGITKDWSGRFNVGAIFTIAYDRIVPIPTISSVLVENSTTSQPVTLTINFGEKVTDFTSNDVVITPGATVASLTNLTTSDYENGIYTVVIYGAANVLSTAVVTIPASVAKDMSLSYNQSDLNHSVFSIVFDKLGSIPTITTDDIVGPIDISTMPNIRFAGANENPMLVTVSYNETVTDLGTVYVNVNGATKSIHSDAADLSSYQFTVSGFNDGDKVVIYTAGTSTTDMYGNLSSYSNVYSIYSLTYDLVDPIATIVCLNAMNPIGSRNVVNGPVVFEVKFEESVWDISVTDFTVQSMNGYTHPTRLLTGINGSSLYSFTITPEGDDVINLILTDDKVIDKGYNSNNYVAAYSQYSVIFDKSGPIPTITIYGPQAAIDAYNAGVASNVTPLTIQVKWNEKVGFDPAIINTFTEGDVTATLVNAKIVPGTFNCPNSDGRIYTFQIEPINVIVNVHLGGGIATDIALNNSSASTLIINWEGDSPIPAFSSIILNNYPDVNNQYYTNQSIVPVKVRFKEQVLGFTQSDIVTGGPASTITSFTVGSIMLPDQYPYLLTYNLTSEGAYTLTIPNSICKDLAGNDNSQSLPYPYIINYDVTSAVPSIYCVQGINGAISNSSTLQFELRFGEFMSSVNSPIVKFNGAPIALSLTQERSNIFDFSLYPTVDGVYTIEQLSGTSTDLAGNVTGTSVVFTIEYDYTRPIPTLKSNFVTNGAYSNLNPVQFEVSFIEKNSIFGFSASDISVTNGVVNIINTSADGKTYTFNVIPSANGIVSVFVSADKVTDTPGNTNVISNVYNFISDITPPQVSTITTTLLNDTTNAVVIPVVITMSESVTGFDITDVTVTSSNATLTAFAGVGNSFSLNIIPNAGNWNGLITIETGINNMIDLATNSNIIGSMFTIYYDAIAPIPTIQTSFINSFTLTSSPTNKDILDFSISFGESVSELQYNKAVISSNNGIKINWYAESYKGIFTFDLVGYTDGINSGLLTITVPANATYDVAGNPSQAAVFTILYDKTNPTVVLTSPAVSPTRFAPIRIVSTFSEPVYNLLVTDFVVSNGTPVNFGGTGNLYSFDINPTIVDGIITVSLPYATCEDLATNVNSASNVFTITYDVVSPLPILTTAKNPTNLTTGQIIPIFVDFGEPVTQFDGSDFTPVVTANVNINGATYVSGSVTPAGTSRFFTFNIVPSFTGVGVVTVTMLSGTALDIAGNISTQSATLTITFDDVRPGVTLTSTNGNFVNTSPIPVSIAFTESVIDFNSSKVTVTNGTITSVNGSGTNYTMTVVPTTLNVQGLLISMIIAENATHDLAGNGSSASNLLEVVYDSFQPTPTVFVKSTETTSPTKLSSIPVWIAFEEDVVGFSSNDLAITGGVIQGFINSGDSVKFSVVVTDPSGNVSLFVPAGVCTDLAGNLNLASKSLFTISYDLVQPVPTITTTVEGVTNLNGIPVKVNFGESVVGFDVLSDMKITNGVVSTGSMVSPGIYTINIVPLQPSTSTVREFKIELDIPELIATDIVTNPNKQAYQKLVIDYDGQPAIPTVIAPAEASTRPIPVQIVFTEKVFTMASIKVDNATTTVPTSTDSITWSFYVSPTLGFQGILSVNVPANIAKDRAGNLNIGYSFKSIFFNATKPVVYVDGEQSSCNTPLQVVTARSNAYGFIYIMMEGLGHLSVSDFETAIAKKMAAKALVTAPNTNLQISTEGLESGTYYAYAIDGSGLISDQGLYPIVVLECVEPLVEFSYMASLNVVQFIDMSKNTDGASYLWVFGDGGSSTETNPIYAFKAIGTYPVKLQVTKLINGQELVFDTTLTVQITAVEIKENSIKSEYVLYPNPSTGRFTLSYVTSEMNGKCLMSVYNASGKLVYQDQLENVTNNTTKSYDLTGLAKGAYFVKFTTAKEVKTTKLIIVE